MAEGRTRREKKTERVEEVSWCEEAGALLLAAAASETGLLSHLEEAVEACVPLGLTDKKEIQSPPATVKPAEKTLGENKEKLAASRLSGKNRRKQLLTLLFLGVVGLRRTCDLRHYSGFSLPLLSGRPTAYGYQHMERFLSTLAQCDGAEELTTTLGKWTNELWSGPEEQDRQRFFYVDGHRKPVYSQQLIPRGLIGRSGKVLGCRALTFLHDEQGHPRLALTARGDHHLTLGLPIIANRYEQINGILSPQSIIVDREGMGATFLQSQKDAGRTMVTLLRANQYKGLESFTEVGPFVPLSTDAQGHVLREVAPARYHLPLPDQPGQTLPLIVALIRDYQRPPRPQARPSACHEAGPLVDDGWVAHPVPQSPYKPRLVPIVTTADSADARELALLYIHRWPAQENSFRDFLLPLGLDTNHGYHKTPVINSEVAKRRETANAQLEKAARWMGNAKANYHSKDQTRLTLLNQLGENQQKYHELIRKINQIRETCAKHEETKKKLSKQKEKLAQTIEKLEKRLQTIFTRMSDHREKCQRYAQKQCNLLRFLEDLSANERTMYELDNRKDQVMTVLKVAVTNLIMWTRDQYFPESYASATWGRLAPFFRLPGLVVSNKKMVNVSLNPFNDRSLNRDLLLFCQIVNEKKPHLPDGRILTFSVKGARGPVLDEQAT